MATLFASDLHLSAEQPATIQAFLAFLAGPARQADGLYLLGDLFELWIGDDAPQPSDQPVVDALATLTRGGVPLWIMPGNRDFLYGAVFAAATGATLLPDPATIDLDGKRVLLMHGDLLCTGDDAYQRFRRLVRDPAWQAAQLAQPASVRLALAQQLRQQSRQQSAGKDEFIMDVTASAVTAAFRDYGVSCLIHGHTHRPGHHSLVVDDRTVERIVLPDWENGRGGYLVWESSHEALSNVFIHFSP